MLLDPEAFYGLFSSRPEMRHFTARRTAYQWPFSVTFLTDKNKSQKTRKKGQKKAVFQRNFRLWQRLIKASIPELRLLEMGRQRISINRLVLFLAHAKHSIPSMGHENRPKIAEGFRKLVTFELGKSFEAILDWVILWRPYFFGKKGHGSAR